MPTSFESDPESMRAHVRAALLASLLSVAWTVASSCVVIVMGLLGSSLALVALGAIGSLDAVGSVALASHFRHALRHEALSQRREAIAHTVVVVGMAIVGVAAVVVSVVRLMGHSHSSHAVIGIAVAGASVCVLSALAYRKLHLAQEIGSAGLAADGRLSAIGAAQAGVAVSGVAVQASLGVSWADAAAALLLGLLALGVAIQSWRAEHSATAVR